MSEAAGLEAVNVLRAFMSEMKQWELHYYPLVSKDMLRHAADAGRDLRPIYERYVTPRDRKTGQLAIGPVVGSPPVFDPDQESVDRVDITARKALVWTQQHAGFRRACRYTLLLRGARWLIDKKETFQASKSKWENVVL